MMKVRLLLLFLLIIMVATAGTAVAAGKSPNFRAHLSGEDAGVETRGQGQALFQFSRDGQQLRFKVGVANIENVTMAHIHLAEEVGGNGPPVVWLYPDGPPPQEIPGRFDGVLAKGVVTADDLVGPLAGETLDELKEAMESGLTYVNVHTTQYPGGEIRGDIR